MRGFTARFAQGAKDAKAGLNPGHWVGEIEVGKMETTGVG